MTKRQTVSVLAFLVVLAVFGALNVGGWNLWWSRIDSQEKQEDSVDTASRSTIGEHSLQGSWLQGTTDERFQQIERQLRGFDKTMVEVGYRFTELYFAGQDQNWDYAQYQIEKLETALRLGLERRPKRAASAQSFFSESLPAMQEVVEKADSELFQAEIERLRSACMNCHVLEEVPYFTVELPEHRLSPIQTIR
jgi:hypothetical protein